MDMDQDQIQELLLKLLRGEADIDPLSGAVISATPPPESPKTLQVVAEVERRKGFDLYQRIIENRYAPSAAQHDHPNEIPPSMYLRRMIDYVIAPVAVYRLFSADFGMLAVCKIEKRFWENLEEAVPAEIRTRFRNEAHTLAERIFDYFPTPDPTEMPEDGFMDRTRIVLNDFYGNKRKQLIEDVGSTLKLFEADMETVYVPYAELVLATVFLQEALDQNALHEYWLIENKHAEQGAPTGFLAQSSGDRVTGENGIILVYGQQSADTRREGFFEELIRESEVKLYDHYRFVEPMVMRRSAHAAIQKGERERPAHPGFYQLHFDPPQSYVHE